MKYNTVIFDLDGTLLNTLDDLADSVNYALKQAGFPEKSYEEIRRFVGNGVKNLIDLAVPEGTNTEDTAACLTVFRGHYSQNMKNKTRPFDGIMELLGALKERGVKMAVVSNKYDPAVKELCRDLFDGYITVSFGESDQIRRKPAPDSVFLALCELGSSREETIYVGDSETDVKTAKNAGLKFVGVTWGYRGRDLLKSEGADYIIDSPIKLLEMI